MCESLRFLHGGDCRIGRRVGRFFRTDFRGVGDGFPCRDLRGAGIGSGAFCDARLRFFAVLDGRKERNAHQHRAQRDDERKRRREREPLDTSFPNQIWL